jgi:hypothetical protein
MTETLPRSTGVDYMDSFGVRVTDGVSKAGTAIVGQIFDLPHFILDIVKPSAILLYKGCTSTQEIRS